MNQTPFTGAGEPLAFSAAALLDRIDKKVLFRSRWKMGHGGESMLNELLGDERIMAAFRPEAVYGYFPAVRRDDALILNGSVRWTFPRLKGVRLSDHIKTEEEGGDLIALSAVTVGSAAVDLSKDLYERFDYAEYFLMYGLAAEMTEALADEVHERVERDLGISGTLRRSFGYPACPDLACQKDLLDCLRAERIGISLSASYQLIPEFSTTAMIFLHPDKKA
ncbi:MAG: hypothetical protein JXR21_01470 [Candidatus Marinimicrobia bacterium]|nr:hypothetical protein [Candidatus Neomarinimicrobiota bacterium]